MSGLFKPGLIYPNDGTDTYVDLCGEATEVDERADDERCQGVTVRTAHGDFRGFWHGPHPVRVGDHIEIHIYRFHPDNRIVSMNRKRIA